MDYEQRTSDFEKFVIPTGYLFKDKYSRGELETLSIGDYGKKYNVKADFLGYTKEIEGVPNVNCMPLSEKWVITLSTQYGCLSKCNFCDVPNVKYSGNASFDDLMKQFLNALSLFPGVKYGERLNIHFARMGEPSWNPAVLEFTQYLFYQKDYLQKLTGKSFEVIHPVLTTMAPKRNKNWKKTIHEWAWMKRKFYGQLGLQVSINSTCEKQRSEMFGKDAHTLEEISEMLSTLPDPISRKYCLNFAYSTDYEIDADKVRRLFDPDKWMCKITPIHNNTACTENNIKTVGGYDSFHPYRKPEEDLKAAGFDVLVFVPSMDEEDGLVTCGNVILGGSKLKSDESEIKIEGLNV
jgi:23S rRNA (adenine2503-C2)-methyltransferase